MSTTSSIAGHVCTRCGTWHGSNQACPTKYYNPVEATQARIATALERIAAALERREETP